MNGISAARNAILALLLLLGALPALPAAQAAEPPEKAEIERLIEQMGASDYGQREAAQKKLLRIGRPAYDLLKAALDAEDAEVRLRAQNLCGWLEPLRGLNSPDPQKRLEASEAVCQQARELVEADPLVALKMLQSAAEVNPEILRFAPVKETAEALPEEDRDAFNSSPLSLWALDRSDDLMKFFPKSPLTEHILYYQGSFRECLRLFPEGRYAPNAEYCQIAGYKSYVRIDGRQRILQIADAAREIEAWPGFLKKRPDFTGADDANYRYARALETKGRLIEACLRLRLHFPDGDMTENAFERLLFIMDSALDAEGLKKLAAAAARDKTPAEKLAVSDTEIAVMAEYLAAVKLLREHRYAEAAKPLLKLSEEGPEGPDTDLLAEISVCAGKRAEFCKQAAELTKDADGDKLYRLASLIYKDKEEFFTANISSGGLSYSTATGPEDFLLSRSRFWQAERIYRKVVKEHPQSASRPKAMYMMGCSFCHLAENSSSFWYPRNRDYAGESAFWFRLMAKEYPDHELAPGAREAADWLSNN